MATRTFHQPRRLRRLTHRHDTTTRPEYLCRRYGVVCVYFVCPELSTLGSNSFHCPSSHLAKIRARTPLRKVRRRRRRLLYVVRSFQFGLVWFWYYYYCILCCDVKRSKCELCCFLAVRVYVYLCSFCGGKHVLVWVRALCQIINHVYILYTRNDRAKTTNLVLGHLSK